MLKAFFISIMMIIVGCTGISDNGPGRPETDSIKSVATFKADSTIELKKDVVINKDSLSFIKISTGNVPVDSILSFAETLIGIRYKYGSGNPAEGFDCSGFITYVYNHFNIKVPRSSVDFTNVGKEVPVQDSKKGDIILFRGTDSTERFIGHIGIIISTDSRNIQFIHATSGKAYGVVVTPLNDHYKQRFVKVVRIGNPSSL